MKLNDDIAGAEVDRLKEGAEDGAAKDVDAGAVEAAERENEGAALVLAEPAVLNVFELKRLKFGAPGTAELELEALLKLNSDVVDLNDKMRK